MLTWLQTAGLLRVFGFVCFQVLVFSVGANIVKSVLRFGAGLWDPQVELTTMAQMIVATEEGTVGILICFVIEGRDC